jgi:multidrug resistance efflux pump
MQESTRSISPILSTSTAAPHELPPLREAPRPEPVAPPPRRKGKGWLIGVAVAAAAVGIAAWTLSRTTTAPAPTATSGRTATASIGPLRKSIRIGGTVYAKDFSAIVAPQMRGGRDANRSSLTIMEMAAAGSTVQAGQTVATFEFQWLVDHIDDQKSNVMQEKATVQKRRSEMMIERETTMQKYRTAKAEHEKAKLDLRTAEVRSEIEAQKLQLMVDETAATLKQLEQELKLQEIAQDAEVKGLGYQVKTVVNHLDRHLRDMERMELATPVGGLVVMESIYRGSAQFDQIQTGDEVRPGTFFMRVVDLSKMVVQASINQVDSQRVRIGQPAEIRLDAYPDFVMPGKVISLGAMATVGGQSGGARFSRGGRAEFVKSVPVEIAIDARDARLIPDLSASADIHLAEEKDCLLIPREAIHQFDDNPVVYMRSGGRIIQKPIEIGETNTTHAEVLNGLSAGEEVLLDAVPAG